MFEKILVCLDGSRLAEQALFKLVEPCGELKSELVLLQVISSSITIPPPESIHLPTYGQKGEGKAVPVADLGANTVTLEPTVGSQLEEMGREQIDAQVYLERLAEPLRERGLRVKTTSRPGDPGEEILRYAREISATLIALTTHGLGGIKRGAPGRVAQYILKEADLPVLLIKPK